MALFQAEHGQRVLFLTPLSTAERSADLLNCKVEHKGNLENCLPRSSLAFKAQSLSPAWLPQLSHLATSASLPSTLPSHTSVLPHGGAASHLPPLCCWLLGPQPSSKGVWSERMTRASSRGTAPWSGPPSGKHPCPLHSHRGCDSGSMQESEWREHLHGKDQNQTPATGGSCLSSRMYSGSVTAIRKEMKGEKS